MAKKTYSMKLANGYLNQDGKYIYERGAQVIDAAGRVVGFVSWDLLTYKPASAVAVMRDAAKQHRAQADYLDRLAEAATQCPTWPTADEVTRFEISERLIDSKAFRDVGERAIREHVAGLTLDELRELDREQIPF